MADSFVRRASRALRTRLTDARNRTVKRTFGLWERLGVHVTPVHFYEPIPDSRTLGDELWSKPSELPGLRIDGDAMSRLAMDLTAAYAAEWASWPERPTAVAHEYFRENDAFRAVDADVLHGIVRKFRPKRVVEIGSGLSSRITAAALRMNERDGHPGTLTCIEPYAPKLFREGFPGLSRLIDLPVQKVPLAELTSLGENDVLFIDSTHVLRIGSDVQYEYLEILPRIPKGVLVHVHDIFLPSEYPRRWVREQRLFWTEQYVLQAFLAFNSAFEILWAGSWMHVHRPEVLERAFAAYRRDRVLPGSFWMRRVA